MKERKIEEEALCSSLSHLSSIKVTLWSLTSNPLDSPSAEPEVRNLFRQYEPFCFREMGPLLTPVFPPPSRVFASRGVLPLSVGTAQKLLLSENLLSSAKLLSRSILFRRRQKRGEPADGVFPAAGRIGGEEKTSSFRIGRDTIFRSCLFAGGLLPGRMLYAPQIGAERNAYDRQIDALFVRATSKKCAVYFLVVALHARARAHSYKTDDS